MKRYNEEGLDGLSDRPREESPPKVDPKLADPLISELCDRGATTVEVQEAIKNKFGVTYSKSHTRS